MPLQKPDLPVGGVPGDLSKKEEPLLKPRVKEVGEIVFQGQQVEIPLPRQPATMGSLWRTQRVFSVFVP